MGSMFGFIKKNVYEDIWAGSLFGYDNQTECILNKKRKFTPDVLLPICFVLFVRFFTSQSTIFQLCRDGSFWVEPVLSKD